MIFLVYHRISDQENENTYTLSVSRFERHIKLIRNFNVPVIHPNKISFVNKGVVFTFDDGTEDHFTIVCPILAKFGISGLFYVPTAKIDMPGYLKSNQLLEMFKNSYVIGSHAHSHKPLKNFSTENIKKELMISREILEELLGFYPIHLAPPGGIYDETIQHIAIEIGYKFFRTMRWGYNKNFDPLEIEIIPMVPLWGDIFLVFALKNRFEFCLKLFFKFKETLKLFSNSFYSFLRQKIV